VGVELEPLVSHPLHAMSVVVPQDCWAANNRTADGKLQPNKEQFPDGMPALVDYVHARGLKIGLYTCAGNWTCHDHRPGSAGHYQVDADTFAEWEVGTCI